VFKGVTEVLILSLVPFPFDQLPPSQVIHGPHLSSCTACLLAALVSQKSSECVSPPFLLLNCISFLTTQYPHPGRLPG
ncbi:hypothetical protein DBR06_SOUSAS2010081, partial [Sousa chinensis]